MEKLELANLGLSKLGAKQIVSFEDTKNGLLVNSLFDPAMETFLSAHRWSFAAHVQTLVSQPKEEDEDDPTIEFYTAATGDFTERSLLPVSPRCISVRKVYAGSKESPIAYERRGAYLYTDVVNPTIIYTKMAEPKEMPGYCVQAFGSLLAYFLSPGIEQSKSAGMWNSIATQQMGMAAIADIQESFDDQLPPDGWSDR